eukprot:2478026-Alexandrium_andersonii.AAC.1
MLWPTMPAERSPSAEEDQDGLPPPLGPPGVPTRPRCGWLGPRPPQWTAPHAGGDRQRRKHTCASTPA